MKKTIEFNTGREYSKEGQIIKATLYGDIENFDYWANSNPDDDPFVIFEDITRDIIGKITLCDLTESAIMNAYDSGNYQEAEYNKGF